MKKQFIFLCTVLLILGLSKLNYAELIDRGGGLVYDTVLNITWLQDANYAKTSGWHPDGKMTWYDAVYWADQLEYYDPVRNVTWDDWRLPKTLPIDGVAYDMNPSYCGETDVSYNITNPNTEIPHMFHVTLGNLSYYDCDGNPQGGYGWHNTGLFENISFFNFHLWSGNQSSATFAWRFSDGGSQYDAEKLSIFNSYAWAVRDGDVGPAPTPPVADAGQEQVVFDVVPLNGSGSNDPNNENLSYDWHLGYRGNPDYDQYATGETPIVSNLVKGFYDVTLMVTNESGYTDEDLVVVAAAGSCFCTASTIHIEAITTEAIKGTKGGKFCQATVTVFDDCGNPVSSATVTGTFPGDFNETGSGVTDANGVAVILTNEQFKKPSCEFCVNNVADTLTYEPDDNVVETYECN